MKKVVLLVIVFFSIPFFSCTNILMSAYGIKEPKLLTRNEILIKSRELGIPDEMSFILNKNFFSDIEKKDTIKESIKCSPMISKYEQPLQLLYFNNEGKLVSFHNNCYMPGFPKLKWNASGKFNYFIPETTIPLTDTIVNRDFLFKYLDPLSNNKIELREITIVVFWVSFMFKQSKIMLKTVRKNQELDTANKSILLFVNTDNCFVDEKYSDQINRNE